MDWRSPSNGPINGRLDGRLDAATAHLAAAIGEPVRARMLYCLMDGCARTSTELSVVAEVSPSTASVHLGRLKAAHLVDVLAQGKHRYYRLAGSQIADVLESLIVAVGGQRATLLVNTPVRLRAARTCYDHIAGTIGVRLHDRFVSLGWLSPGTRGENTYELSSAGAQAFESHGIDLQSARAARRRFACACLDWSERRPHLGGALGAAVLALALGRKWLRTQPDSRALSVTERGRRELRSRFGADL